MSGIRDEMLVSLGLDGLAATARSRTPFARADLERVLAAANPLAAGSLADTAREAASGADVTTPWTLRVRAPGLPALREDPTRVAHDLADVANVEATEMELVGALPDDAPLALAVELVRSLRAARGDLTLRALTASEVDGIARRERASRRDVVAALAENGLSTLSWRPGCGLGRDEAEVHRAAHLAGVRTVAVLGYRRREGAAALLDRADALRRVAEETKGFLSVLFLPDRTEGASPLEGTSGTEDTFACAVARLAFGRLVPRVTADAHVVGHKLGAVLLAFGADDLVGAQAAAAWAPPTDDGPRPLNPDRVRKAVIEARRSPVLRDGLFRTSAR